MQIIIVGCGNVGTTLTEQLSKEGHNISVVDINAAKAEDVSNRYDVMGIVGNGASFLVQNEAGIRDADLMIAVTASDELNLLCCLIAKKQETAIPLPGCVIPFIIGKLRLSRKNWDCPW